MEQWVIENNPTVPDALNELLRMIKPGRFREAILSNQKIWAERGVLTEKQRKIVKRLSSHCRVFVPGERKTTCPEPDFALYNDYTRGSGQKSWHKFSPFIVVEIVSDSDPDKDYIRNVELYQRQWYRNQRAAGGGPPPGAAKR